MPCDVVWRVLSSDYRQPKLIASVMPGCSQLSGCLSWPLGQFPCSTLQSLGCWYEKYGVGICLPGLLLLFPAERAWALAWKDVPVLCGCLCQQGGNTEQSCKEEQRLWVWPAQKCAGWICFSTKAKTGFSVLGITK